MKHLLHYILATIASQLLTGFTLLLTGLVFVSCADESEHPDQHAEAPLEVGISAQWKCGRTKGSTRALVDPLGSVDASGNSIEFPMDAYPEWLHVTVGDHATWEASFGSDATHPEKFAVRKTVSENDNYVTDKFIAYHKQYLLADYKTVKGGGSDDAQRKPIYTKSQAKNLGWEARTFSPRNLEIPQAWDDTDYTTFNNIDHLTSGGRAIDVTDPVFGGRYTIDGNHIFFTLGHAYALVRLFFAVDDTYDNVRYIDLKSVSLGGNTLPHHDHLILPVANAGNTNSHTLFAYGFVKPSYDWSGTLFADASSLAEGFKRVTTSTPITLNCTYDIYDKDSDFGASAGGSNYGVKEESVINANASHRTRTAVTATNTFTFGKLKDGAGATVTVTKIRAGYYYDIYITINPDYLYVLAEHDNKHITIQ